jgi:NADPH2:quinone reductase
MQRLGEKNVSVMRSSLKNMVATRPEFEFYATSVLDHLKNGKIKVKIHDVYSLSNVPRAHEELERRNTTGKLLVKL